MEQQNPEETANGSGKQGGGGGGGYMCRQSSTRWTPTAEQIRILKDLYYNYGVRSPNADQIQRISARLRQYGKIEGKNVFYWFQNHKARERQKKRFFSDNHPLPPPPPPLPSSAVHRAGGGGGVGIPSSAVNKYATITSPGHCSSSAAAAAAMAAGQMGNYGYASVTMEKNFRDCSISAAAVSGGRGAVSHNFGWIAVDPYSSAPCPFLEKGNYFHETMDEEEEEEEVEEEEGPTAHEIETLPLFPMRGDHVIDVNNNSHGFYRNVMPVSDHHYPHHHHHHQGGYFNGCYDEVLVGSSRTSLELSLNSYTGKSPAGSI